mgnify:CR=1 FL=1
MSLNENSLLNGKECYENHEEYQYINHIKNIMKNGVEMKDRTGVGTLSIFGAQMKWSLKDGKLNFFKIIFAFYLEQKFVKFNRNSKV